MDFDGPDLECPICLLAFTREERVPRLLHCNHTFCTPCLDTLTEHMDPSSLLTVRCPFCRWTTVMGPSGYGPQITLWVDNEVWDLIPTSDKQEVEMTMEDFFRASALQTHRNVQADLNSPGFMTQPSFCQPQRNMRTWPPPWLKHFWKCMKGHRSKATTK